MHKLYTGIYSYTVLWVRNDSANRWIFKCLLRKTPSAPAEVIICGKLFHAAGPATAKAPVPIVNSLAGGATRRLMAAERRLR